MGKNEPGSDTNKLPTQAEKFGGKICGKPN